MSASEEVQKLTPERVLLLRRELMNMVPAIRKRIMPDAHMGSGRPEPAARGWRAEENGPQ